MLNGRRLVVWFTGMSGAGKSSIAEILRTRLITHGSVKLLDGDTIREEMNSHFGFTHEGIIANNRSIIQMCASLMPEFDVILVSVISPFRLTREEARQVLGSSYFEVYVKASLDTLILRDTKGLYRKALDGNLDNLIGLCQHLPYEEPVEPDLVVATDSGGPQGSAEQVFAGLQTLCQDVTK